MVSCLNRWPPASSIEARPPAAATVAIGCGHVDDQRPGSRERMIASDLQEFIEKPLDRLHRRFTHRRLHLLPDTRWICPA
jgi:hypothetical protein